MHWTEALKIALQSLWANKLRTALTLLGIMIGVASVIAVITLVSGANHYIATKISGYGADTVDVSRMPSVIFDADTYLSFQKRKDLTYDEYKGLVEKCVHCRLTGAALETGGKVVYGKQSSNGTRIRGYTSSMLQITNVDIALGRPITDADDQEGTHVVVIGYDIVTNVMGGIQPLGQEIRVDGEVYTIVGVGERQGTTLGQSQDDYVIMPLSTYMHSHGMHHSIDFYIKAGTAPGVLEEVTDEVRAIVRAERHDAPGAPDSFTIETNDTFVSLWKSLTQTFGIVIVGIASISLVVGGVVIMNIMLVSVSERTREIGIRKALGAKRSDVLLQFIIESGVMALIGGMIGVIGGAGTAEVVTLALGWPSQVKLWSVLLGLFVASAVGIFFGVYPASKAAALDPIVALRTEL
ncbi:MAG TPA: ABC transporter permease [Acidobacteriaceae bacterium]